MGHVRITNDRDHRVFVFIRDRLAEAAAFVNSAEDDNDGEIQFAAKLDGVTLTAMLRQYWPLRTGPDGTLVGSVDIFANGLVFEDPPEIAELEAAIKTAASGPLHTLVWAPIPTAEEMVLGAAAVACAYIDTDGLVRRGDLREGSLRSWDGPFRSLAALGDSFPREANQLLWQAATAAFEEHAALAVYVARPRRASESGLARFLTDLEDDETIHVWIDRDDWSRSIILERRSPGCPTLHHRIMEPASADSARRRGASDLIARDMERKMQSVSGLLQDHVAAQRAKRDPEAERRAREHGQRAEPVPTDEQAFIAYVWQELEKAIGLRDPRHQAVRDRCMQILQARMRAPAMRHEHLATPRPTTHEDLLDLYNERAEEFGCGFILAGEIDLEAADVLINDEPALGQNMFKLQIGSRVPGAGLAGLLDAGYITLRWRTCELASLGCGVSYYKVDGARPPTHAIEAAFRKLTGSAR